MIEFSAASTASQSESGGSKEDMLSNLNLKKAGRSEESLDLLPTSSEGSTPMKLSMNDIEKQSSSTSSNGPITDLKAVWIAALISFLQFTVATALNTSAFIYLLELDYNASIFAQGAVKGFARLTIGTGTAVFSIHAYSRKTFRFSILCGGIMIVVSIFLYASIEAFPVDWRKFLWIAIFVLHAAAEGANNVFISYIPRISTNEDRQKAYAIFNSAEVAAIIAGPLIQGASILMGDTNVFGFSWWRATEYTLTIYICGIIALVNIFCIMFAMKEPPVDKDQKSLWESIMQAKREIQAANTRLIFFCFAEKNVASFGCTTILTLAPPLVIVTFNASPHDQNTYMTVFQLVAGGSALVTGALVSFVPYLSKIRSTHLFMGSLCCFFAAYFIAIPIFDFYSQPVVLHSDVHPYGCNAATYAWCDGARIVNVWVWIIGTGAFIGIGFPLANIAHDTIYSRLLGGIDQNVLQGLLQVYVNISMAPIPIISISVFKYYGPTIWWIFVVTCVIVGKVAWVYMRKELEEAIREIDEAEARDAEATQGPSVTYKNSIVSLKTVPSN